MEVDIVVVGVVVLLLILFTERTVDPEAELSRLDPLDVDALLDGLERLLDLPMRAGGSDCCRRLLLEPCLLICNHKLYSLCLLLE
jgi:hypothetical protein